MFRFILGDFYTVFENIRVKQIARVFWSAANVTQVVSLCQFVSKGLRSTALKASSFENGNECGCHKNCCDNCTDVLESMLWRVKT